MIKKPDLHALFINTTLTKSPSKSHTEFLINAARLVMEKQGVTTDSFRSVDHQIASGVYPNMREHGWEHDAWPDLWPRVKAADILVIGGPIWLGDNSSETKKIIERLYAQSAQTNEKGQYVFYGKVGGALITGNEDGVKHCASNILYSLQHIGYTIPPAADAGWIGEIGPGASYGDQIEGNDVPVGFDNDFTNRNVTFMASNLVHLARLLKQNGGFPVGGNLPGEWHSGTRLDHDNPEYR